MAEEVRLENSSTTLGSSEHAPASSEQSQPGVERTEGVEKFNSTTPLERTQTRAKEIWKFRLRPADDDEPQ